MLKQIIRLMLPILATQCISSAYVLVDTLMVAHQSASQLAAVGVGVSIWMPLYLFLMGFMLITPTTFAALQGQHPTHSVVYQQQARQTLQHIIVLGALFSCVASMLLVFSPVLFPMLNVAPHLYQDIHAYLMAKAVALPAMVLFFALKGMLEAHQQAIVATLFSVFGLALLVLLEYLLVIHNVLHLPAALAAGVANAIVAWVVLLCLLVYINIRSPIGRAYQQTFNEKWTLHKPQLLELTRMGLPVAIAVFFEASLFTLGGIFIAPFGDVQLAAHQLVLSITSQVFMLPLSFAMAMAILCANAVGEQNWHAFAQLHRLGKRIAVVIVVINVLLLGAYWWYLPQFLTQQPHVVALSCQLVLIAIAYQAFDVTQIYSAAIIRAYARNMITFYVSLVAYFLFAVPLAFYWVRWLGWGATGFWYAIVVGLATSALLFSVNVYRLNRKHRMSASF